MSHRSWLLVLALALLPCTQTLAQWRHAGSIPLSLPLCDANAHYGSALALAYEPSRDVPAWVLGGAPGCDLNDIPDAGVVQVDVRQGFSPTSLRYVLDGIATEGERFGATLATSRSGLIAIGAPDTSPPGLSQAGRISVFFKPDGAAPLIPGLVLDGGGPQRRLGSALAADGDLLAYAVTLNGVPVVQVMRLAPGETGELLRNVAGVANVGFGQSLAIRDDGNGRFLLAIGVPFHDGLRGRIELVAPTSDGVSRHDLHLPAPLAGEVFGTSVAIDGDHVFAGAPGRTKPGGVRSGGVAVFVQDANAPSGYALDRELFPAADQEGAFCGASLAVDASGDVAVHVATGCPFEDVVIAGDELGAVRVFRRVPVGPIMTWGESRLTWKSPPQVTVHSHLGHALALAGDRVYAGAPDRYFHGVGDGSIEIFTRNFDGIFSDGYEDHVLVP